MRTHMLRVAPHGTSAMFFSTKSAFHLKSNPMPSGALGAMDLGVLAPCADDSTFKFEVIRNHRV